MDQIVTMDVLIVIISVIVWVVASPAPGEGIAKGHVMRFVGEIARAIVMELV